MSFLNAILFHARATPNNAAMVLSDRIVTYGMLLQAVEGMAYRLSRQGLQPRDVVAVHIENPVRHLVALFALYRAGLIAAPGAPLSQDLAGNPPLAAVLCERIFPTGAIRAIVAGDDWYVPANSSVAEEAHFGPDDIFRYSYSSGATGKPKAVGMTLRISEDRSIQRMSMTAGLTACDRVLCLPGVAGNWGFRLALQVLSAGGLAGFASSAVEAVQMIELYGMRYAAASTHQLREMISAMERAPRALETLRLIETGGSLVGSNLLADAEAAFSCRILSNYSATESGVIAYGLRQMLRKTENAVGFVAPWARVRIMGEAGEDVGLGTEGTIFVRTSSTASGGGEDGQWFATGDRGALSADGLLTVTGRASQVINAGGVKFAPELVEDALMARGDLIDSAVVQMPDSGEVWLALQPKERVNPLAILEWSARQGWPMDRVAEVDSIPRSATGKILRAELAGLISQRFPAQKR